MTEWIISSGILILIIILLRRLLRGRISLRLQYALWGIVLLRLLIPFSLFDSGISVMNAVENIQSLELARTAEKISGIAADIEDIEFVPDPGFSVSPSDNVEIVSQPGRIDGYYAGDSDHQFPTTIMQDSSTEEFQLLQKTMKAREVLVPLWLAGAALMLCVFFASNLRFARTLRRTRREIDAKGSIIPVYVCAELETPCLFGFFRPAVYLTPECENDLGTMRHVLAHETTHYRHGDNIWAVLRCVCLALHWYTPLVWWAAVLSKRDAELACDEGAIKRLGEAERSPYGRTLIGLTCQRGDLSALALTATTMTGSQKSIKERIMLIAKKPRMAIYTLAAVLLIAAVAVICTFSGAESGFTDREVRKAAKPLAEGTAFSNGLELDGKPEILRYETGSGDSSCAYIRVTYPLKNDDRHITVMFDMKDSSGNVHEEPINAVTEISYTGLPLIPDMETISDVVITKDAYKNLEIPEEHKGEFMDFVSDLEYGELWPDEIGAEMLKQENIIFTVYFNDGSTMDFGLNFAKLGAHYQIQCPGTEPWLEEIFKNDSFIIDLNEDIEKPADAVLGYAEDVILAELDNMASSLEWGTSISRAEMTDLSLVPTGTAGLNTTINMYRLSFDVTMNRIKNGSITQSTMAPASHYLILFLESGEDGEVWTPLAALDESELDNYSHPLYEKEYGNKFTAACMEIYKAYTSETNAPAATVRTAANSVGIEPYLHIRSSRIWTESGWLMGDGKAVTPEFIAEIADEIPCVRYDEGLRIIAPYGFTSAPQIYSLNTSFGVIDWVSAVNDYELERLVPGGIYYVVFGVHGEPGEYIVSEGAGEYTQYSCIFRLEVVGTSADTRQITRNFEEQIKLVYILPTSTADRVVVDEFDMRTDRTYQINGAMYLEDYVQNILADEPTCGTMYILNGGDANVQEHVEVYLQQFATQQITDEEYIAKTFGWHKNMEPYFGTSKITNEAEEEELMQKCASVYKWLSTTEQLAWRVEEYDQHSGSYLPYATYYRSGNDYLYLPYGRSLQNAHREIDGLLQYMDENSKWKEAFDNYYQYSDHRPVWEDIDFSDYVFDSYDSLESTDVVTLTHTESTDSVVDILEFSFDKEGQFLAMSKLNVRFDHTGPSTTYTESGYRYQVFNTHGPSIEYAIKKGTGAFYFTGGTDSLVELYAREIHAREMLSVEGDYAITDYKLLDCEVYAERVDGNAVVGQMVYAFSPVNTNLPNWWAGNTSMGEGEAEGMLVCYRQFTLESRGGGYWECTDMGTGGYGGWGYVWNWTPEEALSNALNVLEEPDTDKTYLLWSLPLINFADMEIDDFFDLMDAVEEVCVGEGIVYGPEEWRTWEQVYPDDQLYRNLYCMRGALNTDGGFSARMQYIIHKIYNHDPELFERCLQYFSEEEQEHLRGAADDDLV